MVQAAAAAAQCPAPSTAWPAAGGRTAQRPQHRPRHRRTGFCGPGEGQARAEQWPGRGGVGEVKNKVRSCGSVCSHLFQPLQDGIGKRVEQHGVLLAGQGLRAGSGAAATHGVGVVRARSSGFVHQWFAAAPKRKRRRSVNGTSECRGAVPPFLGVLRAPGLITPSALRALLPESPARRLYPPLTSCLPKAKSVHHGRAAEPGHVEEMIISTSHD